MKSDAPSYEPPALLAYGSIAALTNSTLQVSDPGGTGTSLGPTCPDNGLWINLATGEIVSGSEPWPGHDFTCYVPYGS